MRTFYVEVADVESWEIVHRVIKVKACTINGAFRRAKKKFKFDESVYQISTRIEGCELDQPVWDFFNGNRSKKYGLRL